MPNSGTEDTKALVTNIQGFSTEDGPGIRTTVFFKGCPLSCPWCHNPEGLTGKQEIIFYADKCIGCGDCKDVCEHGAPVPGGPGCEECVLCMKCVEACPAAARQRMGEWYSVDELAEKCLRDRVYYETSGGGVTASGGEAMVWWKFVAPFFKRLKSEGVHTALDTSGVIGGEPLHAVLSQTDLALIDLKIMDPAKHKEIIGVELPPIIEHIRSIGETGTPIIFRLPLVPGYTDSEENLREAGSFASTVDGVQSIELLPYHRMAEAKYGHLGRQYPVPDIKPPTDEEMERAKELVEESGVKTVIAGKD